MRRTNKITLPILLIAGIGLAACEKKDQKADEPQEATSLIETSPGPAQSQTLAITVAEPGSLKTIMADLGTEMNALQSGLWQEDYELMSASAMKIANHPKVSDSEKIRVKSTMGADMQAFVAMDKMVHDEALALSGAATKGDMTAVLNKFSSLQKNCVTCHSVFRRRLTAPRTP